MTLAVPAPANIAIPIYFDNHATTPVDPRVFAAMTPYLQGEFGNPHSTTHEFGWSAEAAVEHARSEIAKLIGARAPDVYFTSGATESNNIAIKGAARGGANGRRRLITLETEHKCVLQSVQDLASEGFEVEILAVGADGLVDLDYLSSKLDDTVALLSVMHVNNEIGTVQPIGEIGGMCRERGILFHCDAAQAAGKLAIDVTADNIDLLSITAHKMYGPKGIGALYVRNDPNVRIAPLFSGGGQEQGLRPGTLAPHQCVGFGAAASIAEREMVAEAINIAALRDRLADGILSALPGIIRNGTSDRVVAGNLNLSFPDLDGEELVLGLKELAVSSGSACSSKSVEPSHVLRAIGLPPEAVIASLRFGVGRFNTAPEIEFAIEAVVDRVRRLRARGS